MRKQLFSTLIIVFTLSGLTLSVPVQARIKCWTNNEGVKECGNKIPPEFAQKGHQELGKGGLVREKTERAKTDEELAEERRLAKIEADEKAKAEEQENSIRFYSRPLVMLVISKEPVMNA